MAVTFVNATTNSSSSNSSPHTLSVPTGVQDGDLLVAFLINGSPRVYTPPAGWTFLHADQTTAGPVQARMEVYYRIANSEPASYTWTPSSGIRWTGAMLAFAGNDGTTPIADSDITVANSTSSINAPSVDAVADGMLLSLVGWIGSGGSETFPDGMTQRVSQTGYALYNFGKFAYTEPTPVSGSTGVRAISSSSSFDGAIAVNIAIQPAGAAPPDPIELSARGGLILGGRASLTVAKPAVELSARGGLILGGRASLVIPKHLRARGGLILGGRASVQVGIPTVELAARGGLILGSRASIQVEHRLSARGGLLLGGRASISTEPPATNLSAIAYLGVSVQATIQQEHALRAIAELLVSGQATIQQEHNLRAVAYLGMHAFDAYTGPGTGLLTEDPAGLTQPEIIDRLRKGDTIPVLLSWGGSEAATGYLRVLGRTSGDDRRRQRIDRPYFQALPDPALSATLARGGMPVTRQQERGDVLREIRRQMRRNRSE